MMLNRSIGRVVVALIVAAAPHAFADEPATQPAQTPKAVLQSYNAAMRAGDVDAIIAIYHASDETEQRVVRAVARSEAYVGGLLVAVKEKFGDDSVKRVGEALNDVSDADIEAADVTIDGERAVLRFAGGGGAVMVLADGRWRASAAEIIEDYGSAQVAIDQTARRGNFAKVLAQDIAAGQVESVDAVVDRIQKHQAGRPDPEN